MTKESETREKNHELRKRGRKDGRQGSKKTNKGKHERYTYIKSPANQYIKPVRIITVSQTDDRYIP